MNDRLREFIDSLFEDTPKSKEVIELKEEMLQNLIDKYNDLIAEGKSPTAAYNIATASVGDVKELISQIKVSKSPITNESDIEKNKMLSSVLLAVAIMLYVLCPVPTIIIQNEIGVIFLFIFVAAATGLIILRWGLFSKYNKKDSTMVEEYKEWATSKSEKNKLMHAINSCIWSLIIVFYFLISFATSAWYITWIIFIIGGAIQSLVKAIFELRK